MDIFSKPTTLEDEVVKVFKKKEMYTAIISDTHNINSYMKCYCESFDNIKKYISSLTGFIIEWGK